MSQKPAQIYDLRGFPPFPAVPRARIAGIDFAPVVLLNSYVFI